MNTNKKAQIQEALYKAFQEFIKNDKEISDTIKDVKSLHNINLRAEQMLTRH